MTTRYELHGFWLSGPTYKVALMLSLCGEAFDYVQVNLRAGEHKSPAFVAKQRFGQVPLLVDRGAQRHLTQSAAILEYLADMLGRFGGKTPGERAEAREWLFWGCDRLAPHIFRSRGRRLGFRSMPFEMAAAHYTEGAAALGVLEAHLQERSWLVGADATIADIDVATALAYAEEGGFGFDAYPGIAAWRQRVAALPGFAAPAELLPRESRRVG